MRAGGLSCGPDGTEQSRGTEGRERRAGQASGTSRPNAQPVGGRTSRRTGGWAGEWGGRASVGRWAAAAGPLVGRWASGQTRWASGPPGGQANRTRWVSSGRANWIVNRQEDGRPGRPAGRQADGLKSRRVTRRAVGNFGGRSGVGGRRVSKPVVELTGGHVGEWVGGRRWANELDIWQVCGLVCYTFLINVTCMRT